MPVVATEISKDRLYKSLLFLLRRADERFIDEVISAARQEFAEEVEERNLRRKRSDVLDFSEFVDADAIVRKLNRHYRIQGLAEILLPIFLKANLDEEDTRDAVEQAIKEVS